MTFKKGLKDNFMTLTKMEKKHVNKWRSSSQKGCREKTNLEVKNTENVHLKTLKAM